MGLPSPRRPLLMSASLVLAPPALTSPARGILQLRADSGPGEVAANSPARTALGERRDSGEGTHTEGAS